jgi:tetratricopeptide (TPR) repeat protein
MMSVAHALAALLIAAAPLAAGAQSLPPGMSPGPQSPAPALPPDLRAALDGAPEAPERSKKSRAEKLNELLGRLADAKAADPRALQREIAELWSESGSDSMDLMLYRGREAIDSEEYDKALEHLNALVALAPDFAEGWNARATAFFGAGLYGPALADIRRTLALNPRHFAALSGLGLILEETGDEATALAAYRAALSIHPHRPNLIEAVRRLERKVSGTKL